jgi:hypothetical protein
MPAAEYRFKLLFEAPKTPSWRDLALCDRESEGYRSSFWLLLGLQLTRPWPTRLIASDHRC